jgi:NADH dehydrogenase [ubiquinone] 1 alpha subcomplex assembly factor 5
MRNWRRLLSTACNWKRLPINESGPPVRLHPCLTCGHLAIHKRSLSSSNSDATTRSTASAAGSSTSVAFDRNLKRLQRDNSARAFQRWDPDDDDRVSYDYFREEIARRLVDRLDDIKRGGEGFPLALDVGSGPGYIYRAICADDAIEGAGGIGGVRKLVQLDSSKEMLHRDAHEEFQGMNRCGTYRMEADDEGKLPFPNGTFDLVISSCALHWVNNLPGLFKETHVRFFSCS